MGYRCDRCEHEWIPRGGKEEEPRTCPKCKSAWWKKMRKSKTSYKDFQKKIVDVLKSSTQPLTWTEVRTQAGLPHMFPNNKWAHVSVLSHNSSPSSWSERYSMPGRNEEIWSKIIDWMMITSSRSNFSSWFWLVVEFIVVLQKLAFGIKQRIRHSSMGTSFESP